MVSDDEFEQGISIKELARTNDYCRVMISGPPLRIKLRDGSWELCSIRGIVSFREVNECIPLFEGKKKELLSLFRKLKADKSWTVIEEDVRNYDVEGNVIDYYSCHEDNSAKVVSKRVMVRTETIYFCDEPLQIENCKK